jgi:hypothetical protein
MRARLLAVRRGEEIFLGDEVRELERQGAIRILGRLPYPGRDYGSYDELATCALTEEAERIVGAILKEEEEEAT